MKIKDCEKCKWGVRKTWSHPYVPASGRRIGMTHAFMYCTWYEKRCADVKCCVCPKYRDKEIVIGG